MGDLDFELEIRSAGGRDYEVEVLRSPAGEAQGTMRFPFDDIALQLRLQALEIALLRSGGTRRRLANPEELNVLEFGGELFDALISGEVRSRFDVSRTEANRQGKALRVKLRFDSPVMAALPWEFLYDRRKAEYLVLSTSTPLVRYIELPDAIEPLSVTAPLRILGLVASPNDLPALDVERERLRVDEATKDLQARGLVQIHWLAGATWRELQQALRRDRWHVFHFVGHGGFDPNTDEGLIALVGDDGGTFRLAATELGRLLGDHQSLRLAMLNACEGARGSKHDLFSSTAATVVRRGTPAVVAMQFEITDVAAIEFSRSFYEAVADGMPVDVAIAEARKSVSVAITNTLEWGTPVLFMRSADGVLFRIRRPKESLPAGAAPPRPTRAATGAQAAAIAVRTDAAGIAGPPSDPPPARPPSLGVEPTVIDFGEIPAGTEQARRVVIRNHGDGELNWYHSTQGGAFAVDRLSDGLAVRLRGEPGDHAGTISIHSDGGDASVALRAHVLPRVTATPTPAAAPTPATAPTPAAAKRSRRRPLLIAAGVGAAALLVAFVALRFLPGNMVYVPDVIGAWHEDAVATLEGLCEPYPCFAVSLVEEPFDPEGLESGYVLDQSPYLENAAVGSEVVLTIVADPTEYDAIEVPDVVGLTVGEAQASLENACEPVPCFVVTFEYVSDDPEGYGAGYVSDQTLVGEFAIPGSEVQLTVINAAAAETILVPDVTELSVDEARQALEESCEEPPCLVVEEFMVADDSGEPGTVFDQDPPAASEVPRASTVRLYVRG